MNTALWIVAGVLGALFAMAGVLKVYQSQEDLEKALPWTEDFSLRTVRVIGGLELLGAIGLVLPEVIGMPEVVPVAATGLAFIMLGAIATHIRRREPSSIMFTVVLLAGALFVAWGRFGDYAL